MYMHSISKINETSQNNRWMKVWNIEMASEGKHRELMKSNLKELVVEAESVPFTFTVRRSYKELRPAPVAYVVDLQSFVFHLLNERER